MLFITQSSSSVVVPCTREQAMIAIDALEQIDETVSDEAQAALDKPDDATLTPKESIIRDCFHFHPFQFEDNGNRDLRWFFAHECHEDGLWIGDLEDFDGDEAAVFIRAVLKAFDSPELVEISESRELRKDAESKATMADEYGGRCGVVTKDYIRWGEEDAFVSAERQAHQNNQRYYFCSFTEVKGCHEFTSNALMTCDGDTDAHERFDAIKLAYRGEGEELPSGEIDFSDGVLLTNWDFDAITPEQFAIMSQRLSVL